MKKIGIFVRVLQAIAIIAASVAGIVFLLESLPPYPGEPQESIELSLVYQKNAMLIILAAAIFVIASSRTLRNSLLEFFMPQRYSSVQ